MDTSSAAKPIGACPRCGGLRYELLAHSCMTSVRVSQVFPTEIAICGDYGGGGNRTRVSFQTDPPALQGDHSGDTV